MNKKYTAGPWTIGVRLSRYQAMGSNPREIERLAALGKVDFEAISIGTESGQVALVPLDESTIENAMLMAAAPELLEALEMFVNLDGRNRLCHVKEIARAAISKATGQKVPT